jgi:hypothetical protein
VTNPHHSTVVRRLTRALAVTPAALILVGAAPAFAARPEQWEPTPDVSALEALMVIVLIPLGLALVISLLAAIPSMARSEKGYHPGLAWRHEPEWFGGPRDGLEKADRSDPEAIESAGERGGASGHW